MRRSLIGARLPRAQAEPAKSRAPLIGQPSRLIVAIVNAALAYALALLPVSLLPGTRGEAGIVYTSGALALGLVYLGASVRFAWRPDARSARLVLFASLVYLPLLYLVVQADPVIRVGILHG